jgi:hypothetical protein
MRVYPCTVYYIIVSLQQDYVLLLVNVCGNTVGTPRHWANY